MSRAVSRAEAAFALTIGRDFSPFLTILIVFFSDIANFEFRMNLYVSNEFLATQFPNLIRARTLVGRVYACKEEATSANARDARKKGHFPGKYFSARLIRCTDGRKPYTGQQN
jgi:hypothetical protein